MALGALSGEFIVNRKAACYLPARAAKRYLDQGRLFLVPDTPVFPYPVWSVWRTDLDPDLEAVAEKALEHGDNHLLFRGELTADIPPSILQRFQTMKETGT